MIYLLALCIILQVLDGYTTWKAISSKVGVENNKVMAYIFEHIGLIPGILITKAIFIGLMVYLVSFSFMIYIYGIISLAYIWVIINNIKVIKG